MPPPVWERDARWCRRRVREEVVEGAIDGARWDIARGGGGRSEGGSEGAWDRDTMMGVVGVGSRAGEVGDTLYISLFWV